MADNQSIKTGAKFIHGSGLISAIQEQARIQGLTVSQVAARFELATSYWFAICNGGRSIQALQRHRLKLIATFLGKPYVEVLSLAEILEPEDFIIPQTIDDQLNLVYLKLKSDSVWAPLVPDEEVWDNTHRTVKLLLVVFYERLFNMSILDKAQIAHNNTVDESLSVVSPAVDFYRSDLPNTTESDA
jgi:hypothetical protein